MDKRNDEIDLLEVFFKLFLFAKKYKYLFLFAIITGGILGFGYGLTQKKMYEFRFSATVHHVDEKIVTEVLNNLGDLLRTNNNQLLARNLFITEEEAEQIKDIYASAFPEEEQGKRILIEVQTFTQENTHKITNGILHYINSVPYIKENMETERNHSKELIIKIDSTIAMLENQTFHNEKEKRPAGMVVFMETPNGSEIVQLFKEKQQIQKTLQQAPLQIVQTPSYSKTIIPPYLRYFIIGAICCLFTLIISLFVREINTKIKKREIAHTFKQILFEKGHKEKENVSSL